MQHLSFGMKKKALYRVTNWKDYNASLKRRGSLTLWFSDDIDQHWYVDSNGFRQQGRPFTYSIECIEIMLTLRHLFKLPLRQLTGFVESLFAKMGKDLRVPDYSCLSRRSHGILLSLKQPASDEPTHIVVDSTGLKVFGEKEWLETKYGKQYQRKVWRKLHLGIDHQGHIVSQQLTDHKTDDRTCLLPLLKQIDDVQVTDLLADPGYDSHKTYQVLEERGVNVLIPPPIKSVVSSLTNPTFRDKTVSYIKTKGYWAWFRKHNFGRRMKVENTFYRLKTIFGRKLLSRTMSNQENEANIICYLLNKMTDLGMPKTVKIA